MIDRPMTIENASCSVEETVSPGNGTFFGKAARMAANNIVVVTLAILIAGIIYAVASVADWLFGTRLKRAFIAWIQGVSRDRLNVLRKAQIRHVFKRYFHLKKIRIRLAGGSYWLSIPCIVTGVERGTHNPKKYLAKIVSDRSVIKHRYMTTLRNLGVLADGSSLKFLEYENARDMACFEIDNLKKLREQGVHVPDAYGLYRLGGEDYMLVMEFIEGKPLSGVALDRDLMVQVFGTLRAMHDSGMFHGDVKLDNFMVSGGQVVVFDSLRIDSGERNQAQAFDLSSAICALSQKASVSMVLEEARRHYSDREIEAAGAIIDVALAKVDLELPPNKIEELKRALSGYSSPVLAT